jgi:virulence factor Mce-like protein
MAAMVIFAFSCFGLLLFLWLSFGGPIPLKPQGYRFQVAFPEATTLADQADVRVAGVSVGKVVKLALDKPENRTLATIELQRQFAPIRRDARATLRQKTLLGETYVELTLGHRNQPTIPEGGRLANARVQPTVELDEVLRVFPKSTQDDFRRWQANSAAAIRGRGPDLNAVLGNIGPFAQSGEDLLNILNTRREALHNLVRQTGTVFEALTRNENGLRAFIGDTAHWLRATASQRQALAQSIQIFPTFLHESRLTLARLERFSVNTKPLIDDLGPVAHDVKPTLTDLRAASPDLERVFHSIPALVTASKTGMPALSRVLRGLKPVLGAVGPFFSQVEPIIEWLDYTQGTLANFISGPGAALAGHASTINPGSNGHILPQLVVLGSQMTFTPKRTSDNRGNTYIRPQDLNAAGYLTGYNVIANWDCNNTHGQHKATSSDPGCFVANPFTFQGNTSMFPHVLQANFMSAAGH